MFDQARGLIGAATSTAQVRAALTALHVRENDLVLELNAMLASKKDFDRDLDRLDSLCRSFSARVPSLRNHPLAEGADTANRLSGRVRELDIEKRRVEDTLQVVEQVAELKACVAGVVGAMGAPQDWETAAGYLSRASRVPEEVARGGFAAVVVPTIEAPDAPWITLETARDSLCALFLREFNTAVKEGDGARVTRVFKLFPLIDRGDVGLDAYGRYICQGVADAARATFKKGHHVRQDGFFYANALRKLFEHIAQIVESHRGLVERHYGTGRMVKVIERLQVEADVQGGIILDAWSDERAVDRKLTGVKSYPFSFLVQSMVSHQKGVTGALRVRSPAFGGGVSNQSSSDNEVVDTKESDELLNEMTLMLGHWSLYSRFITSTCRDANSSGDATLTLPEVLVRSNLNRKVSEKLSAPYTLITTFFFRRSVEKAFQIDVAPSGLSLTKPIHDNPLLTIQAIDDIMYIVDNVVQKVISTSSRGVFTSVIPTIGRILESDVIGILRRRMQDESYPKPSVQGGFPPEDKIVNFIVLMNSLDTSKEYLGRILRTRFGVSERQADDTRQHHLSLKDTFPFDHDVELVLSAIDVMNNAFSSKATELLDHGLRALLDEVVRPRVRLILTSSFQGVDYNSSEDELAERTQQSEDDEVLQHVASRFEYGWNALVEPLSRIMTPRTYATLLSLTARYLATLLERRVWSYSGRVDALGAIRMERDFSGIASIVSNRDYNVRGPFTRIKQILMIANIDEEEWEEATAEGSEYHAEWVLAEDERSKARNLVRS